MSAIRYCQDSPADYLLNGIIKLLADGRPAEARSAVAKAAEDLFDQPVHRDLFRAIRRAVEFASAPGPLEVQFLIKHDHDGGAPADDVLGRLRHGIEVASSIEWQTHIETSIRDLEAARSGRLARNLGLELAAAGSTPTPQRCEEVIRLARAIQDGIVAGGRHRASRLTEISEQWKSKPAEKLIATGFRPIDDALGGGLPVGIHGIAAAPGAGKSAMAVQLVAGVLINNPTARVAWMRGEMTNDLLFSRLLACWSHMRGESLYPITLRDALRRSPDAKAASLDLIDTVGDRLVVVDPPVTPSAIERWIDEAAPDLLVVDYLQRVEVGGFHDRRSELDHAMRRIVTASTRADIPIVVVSSVAKGTTEHSEIGTLTKESNQLDFDAHTYWSIWPQGDKAARPRQVLLKNNKSRSDETVDTELWFHGAGQFYEPAMAAVYEEFGGFAPT